MYKKVLTFLLSTNIAQVLMKIRKVQQQKNSSTKTLVRWQFMRGTALRKSI
jgi:hypothetical protein